MLTPRPLVSEPLETVVLGILATPPQSMRWITFIFPGMHILFSAVVSCKARVVPNTSLVPRCAAGRVGIGLTPGKVHSNLVVGLVACPIRD